LEIFGADGNFDVRALHPHTHDLDAGADRVFEMESFVQHIVLDFAKLHHDTPFARWYGGGAIEQ
jgi:hypothetical protein